MTSPPHRSVAPGARPAPQMTAAILSGAHQIAARLVDRLVAGPRQVLLQVRANSICGSDLDYWHEGRIGSALMRPDFIPGHEFVGEVVGSGRIDVRAPVTHTWPLARVGEAFEMLGN